MIVFGDLFPVVDEVAEFLDVVLDRGDFRFEFLRLVLDVLERVGFLFELGDQREDLIVGFLISGLALDEGDVFDGLAHDGLRLVFRLVFRLRLFGLIFQIDGVLVVGVITVRLLDEVCGHQFR